MNLDIYIFGILASWQQKEEKKVICDSFKGFWEVGGNGPS
jgi:hypothetical protein